MSTPPAQPSPSGRRDAHPPGSGAAVPRPPRDEPAGPASSEAPAAHRTSGSVIAGGLVMLVLVVLLSWLPLLGPLIAGLAGGWIVADGRRALLVALLPAVALAVVAVVLLTAFELPVLGAIAGIGVFLFVVFQEIPLLLGAWAGGALAERNAG